MTTTSLHTHNSVKKNLHWHIIAWIIFLTLEVVKNHFIRPNATINVADILFTKLPSIYVFYGQYWIFSRFLRQDKLAVFVFIELLFICSYFLLAYIIATQIGPVINPGDSLENVFNSQFIVAGFWVILVYTFFATGYFFTITSIQKEKNLRLAEAERRTKYEENMQLQRQNLLLEKEKLNLQREKIDKEQQHLQTEYAFLRAQINPHFLHNTLNFFYAKSLSGNTQELSEAILILSDIMRYSLQKEETGTKDVPLADELEHIRNVIKINQLRFNNSLNINFTTPENTGNIRIIPLVLITLVENALKHGDLSNPSFPVSINLQIRENAQFYFTVVNKKKNGPKELSNGIGVNNIHRRLNIAYPGRFLLKTTEDDVQYSATLTIEYSLQQQQEALPVTQ